MDCTPASLTPAFRRDEKARQGFVTALRSHVLLRTAGTLRRRYDETLAPAFEREHGRPPEDGRAVHRLLRDERAFRFYSALRCNAQEMVFASVIPAVDREAETLAERARELRAAAGAEALSLDPTLPIPSNVSEIDVHLAPGSYHAEYGPDDVAAGAIYDNAIEVFAFGQMGRGLDDIGSTLANYVRLRYPDFRPRRIIDCGCTIGHNTLPWARAFPAAEVIGIDVAPAVLRYAAARASALGVEAHFRQMNATRLDFPDASVDVVCSSMFLHELPLKDIRAFFREAQRVLRPGGLLWQMELPPNNVMGPYESFYLDWDSYYNNEPFYKPFRDQDYRALCRDAGFADEDYLEATLPRYTFVGEDAFAADIEAPTHFDSRTGRMDPAGTRWFCFGAWKRGEGAGQHEGENP